MSHVGSCKFICCITYANCYCVVLAGDVRVPFAVQNGQTPSNNGQIPLTKNQKKKQKRKQKKAASAAVEGISGDEARDGRVDDSAEGSSAGPEASAGESTQVSDSFGRQGSVCAESPPPLR
jgi:hypothetical protein